MKIHYTLFILLAVLTGFSQSVDWSESVRLTDTLSFNSNPVIAVTPENLEDNLLMFYEKQFATDSPNQIWMRKISDPMGEETQMLADDTIVYRNPMVFGFSWLIFESNPNGNFDLFALEFDESGNPGDTIQLTNTPENESSFFIADRYAFTGCWESEGRIIVADIYGDEPDIYITDTLDSGNCHDPVCTSYYAAWRKNENNESHLYYSENWQWQWTEPDTVMVTGNNFNLRIADANFEEGRIICWENSDSILFMNFGYDPEIITPCHPGISFYHQPTAFNLEVMTDFLPELYSFAGTTDDVVDIFIMESYYAYEPLNISNDQRTNSNPVLYSGRNDPWFNEVLNIWQTQFNGFEALYKSDAWYQTYYAVRDYEIKPSGLSLSISPCPFIDELNIQYYLPEDRPSILEIYNISGKLIKQTRLIAGVSGAQSFTWYPRSEGISLSEGVYFIKLSQGENLKVQKVLFTTR
jgi:hypothetical protein